MPLLLPGGKGWNLTRTYAAGCGNYHASHASHTQTLASPPLHPLSSDAYSSALRPAPLGLSPCHHWVGGSPTHTPALSPGAFTVFSPAQGHALTPTGVNGLPTDPTDLHLCLHFTTTGRPCICCSSTGQVLVRCKLGGGGRSCRRLVEVLQSKLMLHTPRFEQLFAVSHSL